MRVPGTHYVTFHENKVRFRRDPRLGLLKKAIRSKLIFNCTTRSCFYLDGSISNG